MINRETWLYKRPLQKIIVNNLLLKLHPLFEEQGYHVPTNIKVSVGFPSKGVKSKVIGECWPMESSDGNFFEIFIHPNQSEATRVTGILIHEILHTIVGHPEGENAHGPTFKKAALKMGLEGKMKATTESPELVGKIQNILKEFTEPYPHSKLNLTLKVKDSKPTTSVVKLTCNKDGYIVRTSKKWLESLGYPTCPCGEVMDDDTGVKGE